MLDELKKHGGLESYINKVKNGLIKVEPLVIRANAGDCIEVRLTNLLPEILEGSAFQLETKTDMVGYHIHLVKFDTITSDGGANGWNNISGARYGETLIERFYANEELHTVFFHDHLYANSHQHRISKVFSSKVHGDPATPIFKAKCKERVIFRTFMAADKPRNVGFAIHGHMWKQQPNDKKSRVIPLQGAISIGSTHNMELQGGASCPGDYLYRSGSLRWDVESGMWGIFRVAKSTLFCKCTNIFHKIFGK